MVPNDIYLNQKDFFQSQLTKSIAFRIDKLKKLKKIILEKESDIKAALKKDLNKSSFETTASEVGVVMEELNLHIKKLKSWSRSKYVFPSLVNFPSIAKIYPEPYGNVLILSPWNYPFNLSMIPLIGAVSAGNTVVLKPSEYSPNTSQVTAEIISAVFDPKHVAVIQGDAKTAQNLLKNAWDYIFFTGSTPVGKSVYKAAAQNLTPVTLELGGKSPVVVDETAKLKLAARRIVWGKFLNAGQTCIAPDYLLVAESVAPKLMEYLQKEIIKSYGKYPKNTDYYPRIINRRNFTRLMNSLKNQTLVFGGQYDEKDLYISPTIVSNPDWESDLMQYEIFGPILPVITYKNITDAEKLLQKHPKPLAFYIFSQNKKLQKHLIQKFAFGGGVINDSIVHFINNRLPFGGIGPSGIGQYHGKYSFDTFTHYKPVVKRGTWLDVPIRYFPPTRLKEKLIRFFLMK